MCMNLRIPTSPRALVGQHLPEWGGRQRCKARSVLGCICWCLCTKRCVALAQRIGLRWAALACNQLQRRGQSSRAQTIPPGPSLVRCYWFVPAAGCERFQEREAKLGMVLQGASIPMQYTHILEARTTLSRLLVPTTGNHGNTPLHEHWSWISLICQDTILECEIYMELIS
jgi:hypothetical protein